MTSFQTWQQVPLTTTWGDFAPGTVLLHNDEDAIVVEARTKPGKVKLRLQRLDGERFDRDVKDTAVLRQEAYRLLTDDVRAVALPPVLWKEDGLFAPRNLLALLTTAIATTVLLMIFGSPAIYWGFVAGGAAGVGVRRMWKSGNELEFLAPDRLGITLETVLPYALTREQGKLWVPPTPGADRRQLAFQRVEAIRDAHLTLREDIAYRIEAPALFDPLVPATAEFESAIVRFDDVSDTTPTDEVDALASEVEVAFNVARANAERLGLTHFPDEKRDDARRAAKAARLAAGATTEGERTASLNRTKKILDSLALHYLPQVDQPRAIERE